MLSHVSWTRQVSSSSPYPRVLIPRKSESLADGLAPPYFLFCSSLLELHLYTRTCERSSISPHVNPPYIIASRF